MSYSNEREYVGTHNCLRGEEFQGQWGVVLLRERYSAWFFDLNSAGQTWNDNIIWVKGNCFQRDDEALLDLQFRSVKQSVKSTVERKESFLDKVAEEETELKLVVRLVKGIWPGIEEQESELKKAKSELEKNLARAKTDSLKEVKQQKVAHAMAIGQLQVEAKANLDEMAEERDRLGHHLMLKGYSQEEVDTIMADTYVEEEEEEAEVLGVVDDLDGVSPQKVLDIQGDDVDLPKGGCEKVKLDASRMRKDYALMYNREFVDQFDTMKEENENREDQYVKAHFRLEKLNQVVSDLTRKVEKKDSGIKKGLEDLSEATERAENLQRQVGALAVKGKLADMAQYRIQELERTEELYRSNLNRCRIDQE
ncbi:hypothetical protein GIB67_017899 [Kingdonia uniflora]|uniref:Uncharacterized protein n=1 Tax=Kingdonia uniflora TaxID=39325 RepID=A0A7J7NE39_9MAGN|nr:hypothetical protein GIB67_017899 [Kingdonia uniflora]